MDANYRKHQTNVVALQQCVVSLLPYYHTNWEIELFPLTTPLPNIADIPQ